MTYLVDSQVREVSTGVSPATLRVSWAFGDQVPDVVEIYWEAPPGSSGPPGSHPAGAPQSFTSVAIDKKIPQPSSTTFQVPAPAIYGVTLLPRVLDPSTRQLAKEMPDASGQMQPYHWFALPLLTIAVTGAPVGDLSTHAPAPPEITGVDKSRGRFVVHWDSGDDSTAHFNVRVDSATDGRPPDDIPGGWRSYGVDFTEAGVYVFGIEACHRDVWGSSICSTWVSTEIVVSASEDWRTQDIVVDPAAGFAVATQKDGDRAHLDLVTVDHLGAVQLALTRPQWQGWMTIAPAGTAMPAGAVAMAPQPPNDQLDAFFVGPEGRVNGMWVLGHQPWLGPYPLHDRPLAPPGAELAAVRQPPNDQLDVFVIGTDGSLRMLWELDNGHWHDPHALTGPGFAPPGAELAAAHQPPNDQLDVFVVDVNGALQMLWELDNGHWHGPLALTGPGFAPPGAPVCAVRQPPNDQLDVFVIGTDGSLQLLWEFDNGKWQGPLKLTAAGLALPGASVAAHAYFDQARLDVMLVGADQRLHALKVVDAGGWQGPTAVGDPLLAQHARVVMPESGLACARASSGHFLDTLAGAQGWAPPRPIL